MSANEIKRWNIVFLVDGDLPSRVVLLKRSSKKDYAPNFYTGIGGKIGDLPGFENESEIESGYRELSEETGGELNKDNVTLREFARCIYDDIGIILYYFCGQYRDEILPDTDPDEVGTLHWVDTKDLLNREFIPTTREVCREWAKRGFKCDQPFTVHAKEVGIDRTVRLIEVLSIEDGLK